MGKKISEILLRGLPKKGIINLCSWSKKIINMKALDHVCVSHSKVNQYYLSMQNYSSKLGFPIKWYYLRWWLDQLTKHFLYIEAIIWKWWDGGCGQLRSWSNPCLPNYFLNFLSFLQPIHIDYRKGYENESIAKNNVKNSISKKGRPRKARDKKLKCFKLLN